MLVGGARLKTCRIAAARAVYSCGLGILVLLFGARALQNAIAEGDTRTISLHHIHTGEDITITFKHNGRYDEAALEKLNWLLRDWRRDQETKMDPHLIDLVWEVQRETGSKEPVWVVCGYRSPETNAMLRRRSGGVARFSQHMLGHAMDFYIPGVPLEQLRVIGLRLQRGGVGFYPTSGSPFVHMDTGGVRHWPRMTREQLVRVFPDGRTVHIPTDGRPLPGYALALADIRARGDNPSELSIDAARHAGVDVADAGAPRRHFNAIAKFFGLARDEEDDETGAATVAANSPAPKPATSIEPLRQRAKAAVVAAVGRAEDKFVAEKTKIAQVASKVRVISRAEAAPAAAPSPRQVVLARWGDLPDTVTPAHPAPAETTASIGLFAASHANPIDGALAYAELPARDTPAPTGTVVARAPLPQIASARFVAGQTADNETTIAVKRVGSRPASTILSVATQRLAAPLADPSRLRDPWLLAILMAPDVSRSLSTNTLRSRDVPTMAALMVKPNNSVMMTFSADPNPDLGYDRFSGSAIVFVSTVTYPLHTAYLQ